jgi:hypothetical protein
MSISYLKSGRRGSVKNSKGTSNLGSKNTGDHMGWVQLEEGARGVNWHENHRAEAYAMPELPSTPTATYKADPKDAIRVHKRFDVV